MILLFSSCVADLVETLQPLWALVAPCIKGNDDNMYFVGLLKGISELLYKTLRIVGNPTVPQIL